MRISVWLAAGSAVMVGLACGGIVVVDAPSGEGGGGATGTGTMDTGTNGNGGMGAGCPLPAPAGSLGLCGGTATTGAGTPARCVQDYCDASGNVYETDCSGVACVCTFNGNTICTCAVQGTSDICLDSVPTCCPIPFPR